MATNRKIVFGNNEIYHVFNRGIERRVIFTDKRELDRAMLLIKFYKHIGVPLRFSKVYQQPLELREKILNELYQTDQFIDILGYCLMPNHFHFLLKQNIDKGISTFLSNFTNAYTKYFNTKHQRIGSLMEGTFKAMHIESEEQLMHVSRYIHLNPVVSSIIFSDHIGRYEWSSYREYISLSDEKIVKKNLILGMFKSVNDYQKFVTDQIDYAKQLESIKHLVLE